MGIILISVKTEAKSFLHKLRKVGEESCLLLCFDETLFDTVEEKLFITVSGLPILCHMSLHLHY